MLERELRRQFARAEQLGWIDHFEEASARYAEPTETLMAIGSRETNLDPRYLRVPGDNGNGFGLMQVDRRSFPNWCASGTWRDARQSILKGASVLASKRKGLLDRAGQTVRVTTHDGKTTRLFTMPAFQGAELTRVSIAAYNGGDWPAYHVSRGHDPDPGTTGQNYSADVLERARFFRKLLDSRRPASPIAKVSDREDSTAPASSTSSSASGAVEKNQLGDLASPKPASVDQVPAPAMQASAASGVGSAFKAFGMLLVGGYKRVIAWIASAGVALDSGLLVRHPWLIGLAAIALIAGFVVFWQRRKKGSTQQ
jgi:hypothetical protein